MSEWRPIEEPPEQDQACEYQIVVTCKGWFRPVGDEPRFAADDRFRPDAILVNWKPLEDALSWEEGFEAVREFRQQKIKESQDDS